MAERTLPLASDEFIARVEGAGPATHDDSSITVDGRRLDTKEAVLRWLREVEAERTAGRFVDLDDA
jgi:hypothetical protein